MTFREAFEKIVAMSKFSAFVEARAGSYAYSRAPRTEPRLTFFATLFRTDNECEIVNAPTLERLVALCEAKVESWRTGEYSAIEAADIAKIEDFSAAEESPMHQAIGMAIDDANRMFPAGTRYYYSGGEKKQLVVEPPNAPNRIWFSGGGFCGWGNSSENGTWVREGYPEITEAEALAIIGEPVPA